MEGIIDKEEEIFLVAESNLFMLRTITLPKLEIINAAIFSVEVST
jgi:hypothetical protein